LAAAYAMPAFMKPALLNSKSLVAIALNALEESTLKSALVALAAISGASSALMPMTSPNLVSTEVSAFWKKLLNDGPVR